MEKIKGKVLYGLAITIFLASIFLPSTIIKRYMEKRKNIAYYSKEIFQETVLNVGEKNDTSYSNKLLMVSGEIEISKEEVTLVDVTMEAEEAAIINTAKEVMTALYEKFDYPESIESYYGHWYTAKAQLYQYQEVLFNKYCALVWEVTFKKYDRSISHKILIDKDSHDIYRIEMSYEEDLKLKKQLNWTLEDYLQGISLFRNVGIEDIKLQQKSNELIHVNGPNDEEYYFNLAQDDKKIIMLFFLSNQ